MRTPLVDVVYKVKRTRHFSAKRIQRLVGQLVNAFKTSSKVQRAWPALEDMAFLTVALVGPKTSKSLNFHYRKKNDPTDVLSFSESQSHQGLGELVLCPHILKRQAKSLRHPLRKELDYMIIHGFLHLLGYDHEKSRREELKMTKLQDKLFSRFSK
jgi:probable rRNA maturation factor